MTGSSCQFGEFRFVPSARELWRGSRRVALPRRTFECLQHLIAHRDRAVGRDELVHAVFGRANVSDAQLGQIVLRARRAVDDDGSAQQVIRTIAGFGYRWIADTRALDAAATAGEPAAGIRATPVAPPDATAAASAAMRPPAGAAPPRWLLRAPAVRRIAALAATIVLVIALPASRMRDRVPGARGATARGDAVVVLPLQVEGLREDAWMRLGAMDLVAERLREAGLDVPPSENVLGLLSSSGTRAGVDDARLREATGARLLVRGKAVHAAAGWRVELSATGARGIPVPVDFAAHDALQAARGAGDLLLAALGHALPAAVERDAALDETVQRARAAMLANELDTARSILRASPQLAARPAQLAYRLAQVDVRAGLLDQAEAALDEVLARAPTSADARFHAEVLNARGAVRMRRGDFAGGGRDFDAALALLGDGGDALERGQARLGRANSRVAARRFEDALADFGAARIDLQGAGDTLGVARVDANLGMLELYRGRPGAALGYLPGAADRFQSFGALHELLLTLTGLVDAQLSMLQRDAAWATVERASALRERITDPDQQVDLLLNRAQVLTGAGRYREAQAALDSAGSGAPSGNRVLLARARSLRPDLAVRLGRWQEAADAAAAALAEWPAAGAAGDRAGVVRIRQRALLALGRSEDAKALLDRSRLPPDAASEEPGSVDDALAMAEWFRHAGNPEAAARWYRFAAACADRRGVPAEIVAVATAQAPLLLAGRARDAATAAIGRVAPWAAQDFDSALLQLRLFHAFGPREPWFGALRQAQLLAGERTIPPALLTPALDATDGVRLGAAGR